MDPLGQEDHVLFLLSGGGSALFELPLLPAEELEDLTQQLLASGANVVEINTLRKRLSGVKGGRFAQRCAPAQVFNIILSDVIGDLVDMIASGPTSPDSSTSAQALEIAERYALRLFPPGPQAAGAGDAEGVRARSDPDHRQRPGSCARRRPRPAGSGAIRRSTSPTG